MENLETQIAISLNISVLKARVQNVLYIKIEHLKISPVKMYNFKASFRIINPIVVGFKHPFYGTK